MHVRTWLQRHAELVVVVTILAVVSAVFHWIPYKIAFLNFFYLPVLVAAYLVSARMAVLTSVMCVLAVVLYFVWAWTKDALTLSQDPTVLLDILRGQWEILLSLAMWGGFLILTGAVLGRVHEKQVASFDQARKLNAELQEKAEALLTTNTALEASTTELKQQAETLQEKNLMIDQLRQQVERTLYSTMDSTVARLIIQGRLRQEKREISTLFCDLKGFTSGIHSLHPEVILEDLNNFYSVMEEQIEAFHGHIDKYMGDGIMCEFGAPVEYQQHSLQAALTALKMQEKFKEHRFPWQLRIGIASGDAIVGLLGNRRRSYSALGEVVNLAKRLEELCEPGQAYFDENTYRTVAHFVEAQQVRSLHGRRTEDRDTLEEIAAKEQQLGRDPDNPDLLYAIGRLYFQIREASHALEFLRRATALRPDDTAIKVLYADANLKRDEFEKVAIRGLAEKRAVFKLVGLVNPLLNRERFPQSFYDHYQDVPRMLEIPDSAVLPTEAIDATVGHSQVVAVVAYAIADHLGLPEELKRNLLLAGRLQDLGKRNVWHHILNRRSGLSDQERKDLETHVDESVSICNHMGYDRPAVVEIIADHHELMNGTGYPRGRRGEEIPLGARVSCVADVYCALTGWRPYRDPWDSRAALSEIRKGAADGKYDPRVVTALYEMMLS